MNKQTVINYLKYLLYVVVALSVLSIASLVFLQLKPLPLHDLEPVYDKAASYQESVSRVTDYLKLYADRNDLHEVCKPYAMLQEEQPEKAIIFYHGYTSCAEQYRTMAQIYFDMGYNVFVPLVPEHGYADRLTNNQTDMTAQSHVKFANDTINMASELGEKIEVQGLSGGAVITTWIGMNRDDVDVATVISPSYDPKDMPGTFTKEFINLIDVAPFDYYVWWDSETKADNPLSHFYAYPRFSLKGANSFMILYRQMRNQAEAGQSQPNKINFIINAADPAIKNTTVKSLVGQLEKINGTQVSKYEFPAELGLGHDVISTSRPLNQELAYPVILNISEQSYN